MCSLCVVPFMEGGWRAVDGGGLCFADASEGGVVLGVMMGLLVRGVSAVGCWGVSCAGDGALFV